MLNPEQDKMVELLKGFGLTTKEAQLYIASLSLGTTSVESLAKISGIKRTTVYSLLENLIEKGIFKTVQVGFKKRYQAQKPDFLSMLLSQNQARLIQALPVLQNLYNFGENEFDIYYDTGIEKVRQEYNNLLKIAKTLTTKEKYFAIGNQEKWLDQDPEFFAQFVKQRATYQSIDMYLMTTDSEDAKKYFQNQKINQVSYKIIKNTSQKLSVNVVIFHDRVLINKLEIDPKILVIKSKGLVTALIEVMSFFWEVV